MNCLLYFGMEGMMMRSGALIPAAGMSTRMGSFKPLLRIGSVTMAERLISVFRRSGVDEIIMVTGFQAERLECLLADRGVLFLRNHNYAHSDMFDSAKLGLAYLIERCDRILFTPVDVPLFSTETVASLLAVEAELACPVFNGQRGHPLLLSSRIAAQLIRDNGENGMRGAITRCGVDMTDVPVVDEGILYDADTPQDYEKLLELHSRQRKAVPWIEKT